MTGHFRSPEMSHVMGRGHLLDLGRTPENSSPPHWLVWIRRALGRFLICPDTRNLWVAFLIPFRDPLCHGGSCVRKEEGGDHGHKNTVCRDLRVIFVLIVCVLKLVSSNHQKICRVGSFLQHRGYHRWGVHRKILQHGPLTMWNFCLSK